MGFFHDKKLWALSLFKNKKQHDKLKAEIAELKAQAESLKGWIGAVQWHQRKLTPQAELEFIEVHLVEHCNLNCFGCNHFSQIANEEYTSLESYENDMRQLSTIIGGGGG